MPLANNEQGRVVKIYRAEELPALLAQADMAELFAPVTAAASEPPCLLIDLSGLPSVNQSLSASLRQLPCPVIAIGDEAALADSDWWPGLDCVVDSAEAADTLLNTIRQSPVAAMTLVQLSRAVELLPLAEALDMESLAYATLQSGAEYQRWLQARQQTPQVGDDDNVLLLERSDDCLSLSLNRPQQRNAISLALRDALVEGLQLVVQDDSIDKVILRGTGKCFSVGGDLEEFGLVPDSATGHLVRSLRLPGRWLARCVEAKGAENVEAQLHGACIGAGIEMPAFAGRVVADKRSHFQLPELSMGLIPGAGGCVSIPARIGRQRFNWMVLSGRRITVQTALDWGLVDKVVDKIADSD